ncbi:hypothetical protein JXA05_00905 [Candidatus Peregrinibacteria bacterium]|nr:hypothetical protein [Candidatus Peregrinibacteria bacterium]
MELMLLLLLNRLGHKYWEFVIDRLIRAKVHFPRTVRAAAVLSIVFLVLLLALKTPILSVLALATPAVQSFAAALVFVMVAAYFVMTRKVAKKGLERKVYQYAYFVTSLILYVFILIMASHGYEMYRNFVNTQLVAPTAENVRAGLDDFKKEALLRQFREEVDAGRCVFTDYSKSKEAGVKHFVFIAKEEGAAVSDFSDEVQGFALLKGQVCTDGENTFLLTEQGFWYHVISGNGS